MAAESSGVFRSIRAGLCFSISVHASNWSQVTSSHSQRWGEGTLLYCPLQMWVTMWRFTLKVTRVKLIPSFFVRTSQATGTVNRQTFLASLLRSNCLTTYFAHSLIHALKYPSTCLLSVLDLNVTSVTLAFATIKHGHTCVMHPFILWTSTCSHGHFLLRVSKYRLAQPPLELRVLGPLGFRCVG